MRFVALSTYDPCDAAWELKMCREDDRCVSACIEKVETKYGDRYDVVVELKEKEDG